VEISMSLGMEMLLKLADRCPRSPLHTILKDL
jgi:hypothetical protein